MQSVFLKRIFVCFLIIASYSSVKATHIVGGVMNYRYLGNDKFEISLYVYRDCIHGIPPLDNPASIRIWDGVSEYYSYVNVPFDDTLPPMTPDPCAQITTPVCVNWTRYKDTLILPPNDLGYTIYYQRCCRNNTIQNITYNSRGGGAMDWGATYSINIPPANTAGQQIVNSTPVFTNYPPLYICVNKPIVYDNSAVDAEGDSLVYSLCTPLSGAFPADPLNYYTEETPPFEEVVWSTPYNINNMLGGVPLKINSKTGLLTGTPNTTGQFVAGVCVDEYRKGVLLTHTSRDFQFNIIDCNLQIVSSFFAPDIQCNSLTVGFENQSSGATDYKWYFGDGDSSIDVNPSHTYKDTGRYTVRLVSLNNITNTCQSEYSKVISLQYQKIKADFSASFDACLGKNDVIKFNDKSTDAFTIIDWKWNFSNGDSSKLKSPYILYNGIDTSINAVLTVTSSNGCSSSITKTIRLYPKAPYELTKVVTKCTNTGDAQFSIIMSGNNIFTWSPATGLNNPNIQNPTTNINKNITYYITIKTPLANGDTCVQFDSVQVKTINTVQINSTDSMKVCNDSIRLSVPLSTGQSVIWSTNNLFIPIIGTTANIVVSQKNVAQKYYVKISTQECEAVDSIVVFYSDTIPTIQLADKILQCSNEVDLKAEINHYDNVIWSSSPIFQPILSNTNVLHLNQTPKTVTYYVKADFRTCSNIDSIKITVQDTLPLIVLDDSINICGKNVISLSATVRRATSMIWSDMPDFSNIIGTTSNLIVLPPATEKKVYYLKAFYRDCPTTDSIIVHYSKTTPTIALRHNMVACSNRVQIEAQISDAETIQWSLNNNFNSIISTEAILNINQSNPLQTYYVKAISGFCIATDSISVRLQDKLTEISLSDSLFVCGDSVRIHAIVSNYNSLQWSANPNFDVIIDTTSSIILKQEEKQKTYYIKAINGNCETIDSITVFYHETQPSVSLSSPGIFCTDSVFAYAFVDSYTEVEWFENRDLAHLIGTSLTLQITQPIGEHWYYFRASSDFCTTLDSIKLSNHSIKYQKPTIAVCAGKKATVDLQVQSATDYTITWQIDTTAITTKNNSTIEINPTKNQTIYFQINNLSGCSISDSLLVSVYSSPIVHASADKVVIYKGEQVQLTATQNESYKYNWTPAGVLSSSEIYNPTATPLESTTFTIIVTDNHQCQNSDTIHVDVLESDCSPASIYIPNAFSPNGDGINDVFKIRATGILKNMHLEIYDRWGHKVFSSDNINDGWDGIYKNQPAPVDTYGYYFVGECLQGSKIILKGNITLVK